MGNVALNLIAYKNIEIAPYTELLDSPRGASDHKGGPIWPDWDKLPLSRFYRSGKAVDRLPDSSIKVIEESYKCGYWCGPISHHFGHQLADFSTRLGGYELDSDRLFFFGVKPESNITDVTQTSEYFRSILKWFQIPESQVVIVYQPVRVEELYVGVGGVTASTDYLDRLKNLESYKELYSSTPKGHYYVTRSAFKIGGVAGEAYLEIFLGQYLKVIRPETISVEEQLRIYLNAESLLITEGSALHTLQLLGRIPADIRVLIRRPGWRLAEYLLKDRCSSLEYSPLGELVTKIDKHGNKILSNGITIPTKENLEALFESLDISMDGWDEVIFERVVAQDVVAWINQSSVGANNKLLGESVVGQLERSERTRLSELVMFFLSAEKHEVL